MISVIIPAYNAEKTLPYTLRALQNQTLPRELYEVIVVDDASTDGTGAVAREFGVRYRRQHKEGPAAARNLGVRIARGDIVLFTDSDCIPREDWIEKMVKPFEDTRIAGVMGRYLTRQKDFAARFVQLEFEERFSILDKVDNIDLVPSFAAAFRREIFEEVGGFDAHYPLANNEDVELSYKIASRGYRMVFCNDAIVYHRHPSNWKKYLSIKFSRAFWRILVYKKFPSKIVKDSYTPQSLKLQILTSWLLLLSPLAFFYNSMTGVVAVITGIVLFLISCIPFIQRTYKFDPKIAIASPLVLFPKGLSFGLGVYLGLIIGSERDTLFPLALAASDAFMAAAALTLGFWVRSELFGYTMIFSKPVEYFYPLLLIYPLLVLIVFRQMRLYQVKTCLSKLNQSMQFFRAYFIVAVLLMAGMFLFKMNYSRTLLAVVFTTSILLMGTARLILNLIHDRLLVRGVNATRVLIVGCGETAQMLLEKAHSFPLLGYHVVGFIAEAGLGKRYLGKEILGSSKDILRIIEEFQVDEVIFARPNMSREDVLSLIFKLEKVDVSVKTISDLYEIVTSNTVIDGIADIPMVEIQRPRFRRLQDTIKAWIDYSLGTIFMIFSLPFWLIIAILIRIESAGPILVQVNRIGKRGKPIKIFRFRVLYNVDDEDLHGSVKPSDSRVTKFGRFLSRTSLDEWPQLINVLTGQMSLVGPRPERPDIVSGYKEWQKLRLEVKPGITGLWQIMGRRDLFMHQNLEYDFYYIKNRSLLLDLSILLRTIPMMILGRTAKYRGWFTNAEIERRDFDRLKMEREPDENMPSSASA
ncbi:hypothetical protein CEE37_03305 [candidate division LCP-89 bacterium B3_LCP]|uniref:Bacterial sugar transferase domain-containing protein n=1 Tax=candidate division LCP-89 bacterium B3_LCP TaxID=2012998 RepID=A0A532V313_UNCL8|nr:MAG: hypothetical protein CEE37_03305 [candidate division LCP-89 bacterium B3_LCP]